MNRMGALRFIAAVGVALVLCGPGGPAFAGAGPTRDTTVNVQVTSGHVSGPSAPLVIDPNDPERLMTAVTFHRLSPRCLTAEMSTDGGATWSRGACMTWDRSYRPLGAPAVTFGADGSMYLAAIYWSSLRKKERVEVERSTDGGATWSHPVRVVDALGPWPRYELLSVRLSVDAVPASPFYGRLYAAVVHDDSDYGDLAITVTASSDDGATWPTMRKIVDGGLNSDPNFAFGAGGTVFVSYAACVLHEGLSCGREVYLESNHSSDGGSTWAGEQRISVVQTRAGSTTYERLARRSNASFALSPPIAVDGSRGPHAGRLYAAQVTRMRWHLRLELRHSDDQGASWSKPVLVAPPLGQHDQFMGCVAVSDAGVVGMTWLDRRDDPDNLLYRAYHAFSDDGGRTFTGVAAVATAPSDPNVWHGLDVAGCVWAGDRLVAAWPDTRTGTIQQEVGWIS